MSFLSKIVSEVHQLEIFLKNLKGSPTIENVKKIERSIVKIQETRLPLRTKNGLSRIQRQVKFLESKISEKSDLALDCLSIKNKLKALFFRQLPWLADHSPSHRTRYPLLADACRQNDVNRAESLIKELELDVNQCKMQGKVTAWEHICSQGFVELIELFLKAGMNVENMSPRLIMDMSVSQQMSASLLQQLIDEGVNVDFKIEFTDLNLSFLHFVSCLNRKDLLPILIFNGIKIDSDESFQAISSWMQKETHEIIQSLIKTRNAVLQKMAQEKLSFIHPILQSIFPEVIADIAEEYSCPSLVDYSLEQKKEIRERCLELVQNL